MPTIDAAALIAAFAALARALDDDKARLSALDGVIGDGDHGVTMASGFAAVVAGLDAAPPADPAGVFASAAKTFLNAVGASSGPLYATAFLRASAAVKGRATLDRDAIVAVIGAMAKGMADRGKAGLGEKTMMDAWLPAGAAAEQARAADQDLAACLDAAADAAARGAEATIALRATKGRAARLGDRAIGHMDPGAASAALMLRTLAKTLGGRPSPS